MTGRGDHMEAIEEVIAAYEKDNDKLISQAGILKIRNKKRRDPSV